jgi:hypothetical protein
MYPYFLTKPVRMPAKGRIDVVVVPTILLQLAVKIVIRFITSQGCSRVHITQWYYLTQLSRNSNHVRVLRSHVQGSF